VVEDDDEAAVALEELEPSPAEPIVIEPNSFYLSTGFSDDGGQQCDCAWLELRVIAASEQLVRARLLFNGDAYWDWWAASPGVAGGISPSALLQICADEPRGVEAPAGRDELVHVSDARRLEAEDIAEVFSNCLPRSPEAVWPADLLGLRAARLAAPRQSARPTKESAAPPTPGAAGLRAAKRTVVGRDAPFDELLGDSALAVRAAGLPLDLGPARDELRLAAARSRFASAAPGAAAAGAPLGSAEGAPSEGKPKKRGFAEVLAERMAKVAKAPSAEAARGSRSPAAADMASGGAAGEGAKELATALMAVLKSSVAQAASSSGAGAASDPLSAADGAAATGGLATKRARCRKMAQDQPGRLSELTLMQMAEFLGAVEGDTAVGPTTALVLRHLHAIYLPQNPVQQIGVAAYREMRTLAEAIDFLLQGKIPQALDILTQRLKAAQVAVGDGHWGAAKWLELILAMDEPSTLRDEEEEMVRSIELGELKLEELSSRLRKPQARLPGNRAPDRPRAPKGSAREGEGPPHQRAAQLDKTAEKLPAGVSQAPRNFRVARAVSPRKDGETSKECKVRPRALMTESRGQRRLERLPAGASSGGWRALLSHAACGGGLPAAGCAARDAGAWCDEVTVLFGATITSVDMTVHLVQLVERHPGSLGTFSREFAEHVSTLSGSGRRVRDLLPLPLPSLLAVRRWCKSRDAGHACRARPVARQVAEEAWLLLTVAALNYTYGGLCREGWRHRPILSQAQQQAMGFLRSRVVDFLGHPFERASVSTADAALSEATVDYSGEPLAKALPCVLAELASGLPQPEHAAELGALDFVEPDVAEWLASPEKALLPEADWPDSRPRARANVADEAGRHELAVHLAELGIFAVLSEDQFVRVRGEPLLNGSFAVAKEGKPGPGCEGATGLILNMVLGNALLKPHVGEASLLAASTSWVSLHMPEGKLLLWSGDDQKGAFFVWRIPKAWHPDMAVGRSPAGALFGRPERQVYIAPAVIAMGWMLAVPIFQHIHRTLRRLPPPRGAGLPPELEWQKCEARPIVELSSGCEAGWWQVYIDDFDAPEIVDEARARQLGGTEADCQQRVRESYRCAGVAYSAEKAHLRETRVDRMGADVDGVRGRLAAPGPKALSTAALCLATLSQERAPWRVCMIVFGELERAFEFGRPLSGLLNSAWPMSTARSTVQYNAEMVEEFFSGLMLLPTAATSLRARIEGMVTVSDASEFGGGVCAFTSLRGEATLALKSVSQVADHLGAGTWLLSMPVDPRCPWTVSNPRIPKAVVLKVLNVLVGGLFDVIGGLAVLLWKLPVRIFAYVAAETDAKAGLVIQLRWPGAFDWGGVARGGESLVQDLFAAFSETVDAGAAGTGGPCQDLSRLGASGGGLHGHRSSLFYEVPWIFWLVRLAFGRRFYSLLENVARMTDENVKVAPPLRLVDKGRYIEVMADNGLLLDIEWEDQKFRWAKRPSCTEREPLLGFDVGYTAVATKGSDPQAASDARAVLLGNSFSVCAIARVGQCRETWDQCGCFEDSSGDPNIEEARRLALYCLGRAEQGGSDARLDCGLPCRPRGCPRSSLGPFVRRWHVVLSMAWPREARAHINVRELQAALAAMR
ncbi:unnamed protein product, partial [Prorocentrum cordatum]